jgi:hypothetical protein
MVHRVAIKRGVGFNLISVKEFLAIPMDKRIQLILEGKVQFLDATGQVISPREATKMLRDVKP